jgi:hypothetical protein
VVWARILHVEGHRTGGHGILGGDDRSFLKRDVDGAPAATTRPLRAAHGNQCQHHRGHGQPARTPSVPDQENLLCRHRVVGTLTRASLALGSRQGRIDRSQDCPRGSSADTPVGHHRIPRVFPDGWLGAASSKSVGRHTSQDVEPDRILRERNDPKIRELVNQEFRKFAAFSWEEPGRL